MPPFIGVTCTADGAGRPEVKPAYVAAVHGAAALPVPLPFVSSDDEAQALLERLDGIVFTGSDDLDSVLWNEPLHPRAVLMHPARATSDLLLARAALARRLPALGICGGMQLLNVAAGGSLHQHLPDRPGTLDHKDPSFQRRHALTVAAGSVLAELLGGALQVNTEHHQGVDRLGRGLMACAWAPDGVVEAIVDPEAPFTVGVQWHPERLQEDEPQRRLFRALARAAARGGC
jgi:putative glutamine amidotransferase